MDCLLVELKDSAVRDLEAISKQEGCSMGKYLALCLQRDIASRKESGWNVRDGWAGREKLGAMRAASFLKTPPQA